MKSDNTLAEENESNGALIQRINYIGYGRRGTNPRGEAQTMARNPSEPVPISRRLLLEAQYDDEECRQVMQHLERYRGFEIEDGLLVWIDELDDRADRVSKIVVPKGIFTNIMYSLHDSPIAGHFGLKKTLESFRRRYYMPNSRAKVSQYVKSCHHCQTRKQPWTRKVGLLEPLVPTAGPFERIGIDTIGPMFVSKKGNKKVVVITDYMTRYAIARAVPRESADVIAGILMEEIFLVHGAPEVILTDRGKSFRTDMMRELYKLFEVKHVTSTAYHPQTNGLVERLNKTFSIMLSMYVNVRQ